MGTATAIANDDQVDRSLRFWDRLLEGYPRNDFSVRLWNGLTWPGNGNSRSRITLALNHPGALRNTFWPPTEANMGEGYIFGDYDLIGDAEGLFDVVDYLVSRQGEMSRWLDCARWLLFLPKGERPFQRRCAARLGGSVHSRVRDRKAIRYHYDVSNDFYALWLDKQMVYSCACFADPDEELEKAQERKLDLICRKLGLRSGDRFLDIGCGWGGLIIHAARRYGVRALGITLSKLQAELAEERIRAAGLGEQCRVEVMDYRELPACDRFDKIASVGMFEHVGKPKLEEYFKRALDLLKPGGLFLNHGISEALWRPASRGPSFVDRYVFPDGELLPICTTLKTAEEVGFEVRDLESLREHYAMTLRRWVRRLEARYGEAVVAADEVTYRIWRLFMAGSAHNFHTGLINVYQTLLLKPSGGPSTLPLCRSRWYRAKEQQADS